MKAFRTVTTLSIAAALSVLVACSGSGGGGGSSPIVTPPTNNPGPTNPPPPPPSSTTISSPSIGVSSTIVHASPNYQNGSSSWYTGGVTAWASNAGATNSGTNGTNTIDGISCTQMGEPSSTNNLHVHAFVGLIVNGTEEAIPSALGMWNPTQPSPSTASVPSASCFYHMHTHDYSGLIHIEDSSLSQSYAVGAVSYATLKNLFDLWGEPINASTVATFSGNVAMYIGTPTGTKSSTGSDIVTTFSPFNGDLTTIKLGHHEAIWIVVGAPPAAIPQVEFDIEV